MKISIELNGVSFSYGEKPVLREVSVSLAAGEFVCLLGPNGAGKTTLAQLIAGELSPTEGRVFLTAGDASGKLTVVGRHIAYLPQDLQDPPFVTVRELVSLGRFSPKRSLGWRVSAKDREVVQESIDRCLAESLADRPFAPALRRRKAAGMARLLPGPATRVHSAGRITAQDRLLNQRPLLQNACQSGRGRQRRCPHNP